MMLDTPYLKIEGIPNFWIRIQKAKRRVLALDYDGTLAPFKIERMKAKPLHGILAYLTSINMETDTRLAILSGRPISELEKLLGPITIEMIGLHGFEYRNRQGQTQSIPPEHDQKRGLEEAHKKANEAKLGINIESKNASIAFHTRGTIDEPERCELIRCLWIPIAEKHGLELHDFNGGVELRATGFHKGTAVLELMKTEPDDALIVYLGDDETDEDAFRVIRERGIGIKVGGYGIQTAATGRLANCEAVRDFLRTWHSLIH